MVKGKNENKKIDLKSKNFLVIIRKLIICLP